jgi:hypothetical protein
MIREFFVPRFFVAFAVLLMFFWGGLWVWGTAFPKERRRWLRGIRVPLAAAGIALTLTVCFAAVLSYWK